MAQPLRIWRLSDGRRGHDNQSLGLIDALSSMVAVDAVDIEVLHGGLRGALAVLANPVPGPRPRLVVGAGHATHLAMAIAARRQRARSVVLMSPSLPRALFDLCIVPVHDGVQEGGNVLLSLGALNRVRPGGPRDASAGLFLVGGPSRHHRWDDAAVAVQVREIVSAGPGLRWEAAGSPRTPESALARLAELPQLRVVAFRDTSPDWLPERLGRAGQVWVTPDSVSMAYEAVSGGAATGLLSLPPAAAARRRGPGRVEAAAAALLREGLATSIDDWRRGHALCAPPAALQEAQRCARVLLDRWPDLA